jgi:hypothetical protein
LSLGSLVNQRSKYSIVNFIDTTDAYTFFTHKEDLDSEENGSDSDGDGDIDSDGDSDSDNLVFQYTSWNYHGVIADMKKVVNYGEDHDHNSDEDNTSEIDEPPANVYTSTSIWEDDMEVIDLSKVHIYDKEKEKNVIVNVVDEECNNMNEEDADADDYEDKEKEEVERADEEDEEDGEDEEDDEEDEEDEDEEDEEDDEEDEDEEEEEEEKWKPPCRTNKVCDDGDIEFEYNEYTEYKQTLDVLRFIEDSYKKYAINKQKNIDFVLVKIKHHFI